MILDFNWKYAEEKCWLQSIFFSVFFISVLSFASLAFTINVEFTRDNSHLLIALMDKNNMKAFDGVTLRKTYSLEETLFCMQEEKIDLAIIPSDVFIEMTLDSKFKWQVCALVTAEPEREFFPVLVKNDAESLRSQNKMIHIAVSDSDSLRVAPLLFHRLRNENLIVNELMFYPEFNLAVEDLNDSYVDGILVSPEKLFPVSKRVHQSWSISDFNGKTYLSSPMPWAVMVVRAGLGAEEKNKVKQILKVIESNSENIRKSEKKSDEVAVLLRKHFEDEYPDGFLNFWIKNLKFNAAENDEIRSLQKYSSFLYNMGYIDKNVDLKPFKW